MHTRFGIKKQQLRVVIIEDDYTTRDTIISALQGDLEQYVHVVGYADNLDDALILLNTECPDLILFDIHIIGGTAFEVLDRLQIESYLVIFITSFAEYATKVFEYNTVDFIVKPIVHDQLQQRLLKKLSVFQKFEEIQQNHPIHVQRSDIDARQNVSLQQKQGGKFRVMKHGEAFFIPVSNVVYCKAERSYTVVVCADSSIYEVTKPLATLQEEFESQGFFVRVHRSYVVNVHHIASYYRNGRSLLLRLHHSAEEIPVARLFVQDFLSAIQL
jgi:two-component system LytT family response regulator